MSPPFFFLNCEHISRSNLRSSATESRTYDAILKKLKSTSRKSNDSEGFSGFTKSVGAGGFINYCPAPRSTQIQCFHQRRKHFSLQVRSFCACPRKAILLWSYLPRAKANILWWVHSDAKDQSRLLIRSLQLPVGGQLFLIWDTCVGSDDSVPVCSYKWRVSNPRPNIIKVICEL